VLKEKYPNLLKRKKYIERYNQYKEDLRNEASDKNFIIPDHNWSVVFFVPVPKSWTKKKKAQQHLKLHRPRPDIDNFLKALFDPLKTQDSSIAHLNGLEKRWVNFPTGWIEIIITEGPEPPYLGMKQRAEQIALKLRVHA
jgi:Holliday junction resolvase RusA-like endonuclease